MASKEHFERLLESAKENNKFRRWNEWREKNPVLSIDLEGANIANLDLQESDLEKANLRQANLRFTNLEKAFLEKADLQYSDLRHANLVSAHLTGTNLEGARLEGANLAKAHLWWANCKEACLQYANLEEAALGEASLEGANLYKVTNITVEQICQSRNVREIMYLSRRFILEMKKCNPELMRWWHKKMFKEIEEISLLTDEEGWTGRWIEKNYRQLKSLDTEKLMRNWSEVRNTK